MDRLVSMFRLFLGVLSLLNNLLVLTPQPRVTVKLFMVERLVNMTRLLLEVFSVLNNLLVLAP